MGALCIHFIIYHIIVLLISFNMLFNIECCNESSYSTPKYHLIEKCHRSKLGIAAKANYTSLRSCERLGIEKKALAINFAPRENFNSSKPIEYTCEVLKCAETINGTSLINDTRYDYYSIYAKPLPNITTTCVPATGMFLLDTDKLNYTQAHERCYNLSSVLADVFSEQRTMTLAQVLLNAKVSYAYVGMRRGNDSIFYNSNGEGLNCITYRAWAPGHPRRNLTSSCVTLTRNRKWKTTLCINKFQPLCELIPGGPYKKGSMFASRKPNITLLDSEIKTNHTIYANTTNTVFENAKATP